MGLSWLNQLDLVLVLVLAVMATSTAIKLTGDNVCQRTENYTISLKESFMEPVVVNTFAWCLQIPPRCPKSRVEMREKWRIKTETRQKKIAECCDGYVLEKNETRSDGIEYLEKNVGRCVPRCDVCEHGYCVDVNTCECQPGYQGNGCTHECPTGTWGRKCAEVCNCRSMEICNPLNGQCHCPSGWQGPGCEEKCPPGFWGVGCTSVCTCDKGIENEDKTSLIKQGKSAVCHHESGNCTRFPQTVHPSESATPSSKYSTFDENIRTNADRSTRPTDLPDLERIRMFNTDNKTSYTDGISVYSIHDVTSENISLSTMPANVYGKTEQSSTISDKSPETSVNGITTASGKTETIVTKIDTNEYDNYKVQQRIERVETRVSRIKKPSTPRPIVAVLHVSGNGSPDHDTPMIVTSIGGEKIATHAVAMPLDMAAMIIVGSIVSLGLTTLAVLAVFHVRSKLLETIRLSIYDTEKSNIQSDTIRRGATEKGNSARISSNVSNNSILACEYETPRCMILEHQTLTRSRPASSLTLTKKPIITEANYSNDYPNMRICDNLHELLQAHYDRPPSTFRPTILDVEGEHVYDEIPLQSSTTFTKGKTDS